MREHQVTQDPSVEKILETEQATYEFINRKFGE